MASIQMIQIAPLSSPSQPSSEHKVVLSDDHLFSDLVKAIIVMQAVPERHEHLIFKINETKLPKLEEHRQSAAGEVKEDSKYKLVVLHQVDKRKGTTIQVHIESECLRDLLQAVLKDVCGITLDEDRLSIEQSEFQALLQKYGVCHSLMDFHLVGNTNPEGHEPDELFIDLDLLEGYSYP